MLGKIEGQERMTKGWDGWMASLNQWSMGESTHGIGDVQSGVLQSVGVAKGVRHD